MLYDTTLLFGVLLGGAGLADLAVKQFGGVLDPQHPAYQLYLLSLIALFFCYFWVKGGQTLGMRAWRLRVVRYDGAGLHGIDALRRFVLAFISLAPAGLGLFWSLIPPDHLAWHDSWSKTRMVLLPKGERQ